MCCAAATLLLLFSEPRPCFHGEHAALSCLLLNVALRPFAERIRSTKKNAFSRVRDCSARHLPCGKNCADAVKLQTDVGIICAQTGSNLWSLVTDCKQKERHKRGESTCTISSGRNWGVGLARYSLKGIYHACVCVCLSLRYYVGGCRFLLWVPDLLLTG